MASRNACTSAAVIVAEAAFFFTGFGAVLVCANNPATTHKITHIVPNDFIILLLFFVDEQFPAVIRRVYRTCLIASFTLATTLSGSGAYDSAVVIFWPSVTIQLRKSLRIFPLAGSFDCSGIRSHVKLQIG